ncbi:MAG: PEP-CTERM sorting domain-containing protein [Janthinobacterium lividum]
MKFRSLIATAIVASGLFASSAFATTIDYFTGSVTTSNPTELGRFSRNAVPQTWTGQETYPGLLASSTATTYYYTTYTYAASLFTGAPYVSVSFTDDNNTALTFITAYAGSYNPSSRNTGWLGDEGGSGDYFTSTPLDGRYFDVILPVGQDLVLMVTTTGGGTSGTGQPYEVAVNAFADTMYTDAPAAVTPEPSTIIELGTGMLAMMGVVRRRFRVTA